jgi:hypothetical protein
MRAHSRGTCLADLAADFLLLLTGIVIGVAVAVMYVKSEKV